MWQHVKFSVQICSWDILACCWDVKQPTNCQWTVILQSNLTCDPPPPPPPLPTTKWVIMCQAYFCSSKEFAAGVWKCWFWDFGCNCLRNHLSLVSNLEIAHFSLFHGQKHDFFNPTLLFYQRCLQHLKQVFPKVPNVVQPCSKTCSSATSPLIWKWFSPL